MAIPSSAEPLCKIIHVLALIHHEDTPSRYFRHLLSMLLTSLIAILDVLTTTHYSRRELLRELNNYNVETLIRARRWDTNDPTFVDGTSVATTLYVHHKDVILDALRLVCPTDFIPTELLRETRMTIYIYVLLPPPQRSIG